jgi:glycosyltransferase involved in cell wall biosynthesis
MNLPLQTNREIPDSSTGNVDQSERVAYVMPVFEAQQDFEDTMRSLANSPNPCTVFVVDDGSQTPLQIPDYGTRLPVHLIRLEQNRGMIAALNAGVKAAIAAGYEYIARIDAGDYCSPGRLALQIAYLKNNPECMLVGSDAEVWDEDGSYCFTIRPPRDAHALARALHERAWLLHPTFMFRACVFSRVGLYTERYPAAEDYEIILRIAMKHEIGVVPEPLVTYVLRQGGISGRNMRVQAISRLRIQILYFQWTSWTSYYGMLRTVGTLLMPRRLKRALKLKFLYRRIPPPVGVEGSVSMSDGSQNQR